MPPEVALSTAVVGQTRSTSELARVQAAGVGHAEQLVDAMRQELQSLQQEHAAILKRIRLITQTLGGLTNIFSLNIANGELHDSTRPAPRHAYRSDSGLTQICRRTLMGLSEPITSRQLCCRIEQANPLVLARHKRPASSVYVVLTRLVSYREVLEGVNERNVRTWLWVGSRQHDGLAEDQLTSPLRHQEPSTESAPASS